MTETGIRYLADAGPETVEIYADTGGTDAVGAPEVRHTMRLRAPDHGDVDAVLVAYGWHRVGPWSRSDDMPEGHRLAMVEFRGVAAERVATSERTRHSSGGGCTGGGGG